MDELTAPRQRAESVEAAHHAGRTAWPAVELPLEELAAYLARLAGDQPVASWLVERATADLYLACACAARSSGLRAAALAAFDDELLSQVGSFLARMRPDRTFVDEVRQVLREKLFVGDAPKIAEYTGRGSLVGWLRVVTVRTALNLRRRRTDVLAGDAGASSSARGEPSGDPELDYLKDHYRPAFRAAIEASFAALSSEHRNLLRLHFLDGMTLHQLATLFQVHRATVARWIAQARSDVLAATRVALQQQLVLETAELDSMMQLLDSRLELSMQRLLQAQD